MKLDRRTVNFAPGEASFLERYKDPDTPEHDALLQLAPDVNLDSDSHILKVLVLLGHQRLKEETMSVAYERAIDNGEFDAESRAAMHRSRKVVSRMTTQAK